MSINTLTNAAVARRGDFAPFNRAPNGLSEIAQAAAGMPAAAGPGGAPLPTGSTASNGVTTAMNVLTGYIPTEIITLYVAVIAALQPKFPETAQNAQTGAEQPLTMMPVPRAVFFGFLVATPIALWVIYASKVKSAQKPVPIKFAEWPVWEMFAATVAYCAWALAFPANSFSGAHWYTPALAGVVVLVTSTVLGLLAPIFQNTLK